ncbi:hypothetical protein N7448_010754 [Penicillium atrosanguineum]|uniref:Uncharacterized protein n=1 Tax=Penicillium atrosanguineum TaxID=1132637 RepID=A0A9W9PPE4_9EURO|nr:Ran GTPase-activating protein 1 [Penicillium atrosanguineum]KAJ5119045.1 hypothetical protein N7526_010682 [Penicillium atrosanguineum]KAJ5120085.1 hypothetical protein N7448_010754 [Penicillium atrosanguineum]KAJ5297083.1 Ran GTPase-activating protein 1 [Penicillium atrosanguineum]KAJ5299842.1 hypothetical protein N7476_011399 [Penicillium atrosanguineum]
MPLPTASVGDGWFTFQNLGPATATFTPAPSCSASDRLQIGVIRSNYAEANWNVQCSTTGYEDCLPPTTTTTAPATTSTGYEEFWGYGAYYSPGLNCPSGWETIGLAARDANQTLSYSGIMVPTTTTAGYYRENHATILANVLESSETMALCCPSAMTADGMGGCYSAVPDYKPTVGCYVYTTAPFSYQISSVVETRHGAASTFLVDIPEYGDSVTKTYSRTFNHREQSRYTGISYVPMVTLVHHQSDTQPTATRNATAATSTSTTTSNAAGRLAPRSSTWDGLGAVVGISAAAMALGAAILF